MTTRSRTVAKRYKDYFKVDRKTWVRGGRKEEFGVTELLNTRGNRCCLGHFCAQMGVPDKAMEHVYMPHEAAHTAGLNIPYLVEWTVRGSVESTDLAHSAATINDDTTIDDAERERRLTALFASHGIELEFVG